MWECKQCKTQNNNSSLNCHGKNCKALKEFEAIKPINAVAKKIKKVKTIYDYCPACKKDMFFTPTIWKGKKAWSCESKNHRPCLFTGKSKPMPEVVIE